MQFLPKLSVKFVISATLENVSKSLWILRQRDVVFYSVSTGTYFISFDNTKMNLDVIEI